ncbi:MAG TPA: trypsin-like peptidase domain-containing protein [Trebonia sp.]|nr:trypsin-like peptidase domain-containing protein [Trebonia sp.]
MSQPPAAVGRTPTPQIPTIYEKLEPTVVDVTSALRYNAETAEGTGFVINAAGGLILTNNHVIRGATTVTVTLTSSGRQFPARIVGEDVAADVALLQIQDPAGLATAAIGNSSALPPGSPVLAIGNQAGVGGAPTVAPGVITGKGQTIQANDASSSFTETLHNMLVTNAHVAPGDSGGPLADAQGQVVGMITAAGTSPPNAGYAIPINYALAAARLIAVGRPAPGVIIGPRAFLGIVTAGAPGPGAQRRASGLSSPQGPPPAAAGTPACLQTATAATLPGHTAPARSGALVYGVLCGTGADAAGLAAGDVITSADGRPVTSPGGLTAIVNGCRVGALVPVTWVSTAGKRQIRLVRLDLAPAA